MLHFSSNRFLILKKLSSVSLPKDQTPPYKTHFPPKTSNQPNPSTPTLTPLSPPDFPQHPFSSPFPFLISPLQTLPSPLYFLSSSYWISSVSWVFWPSLFLYCCSVTSFPLFSAALPVPDPPLVIGAAWSSNPTSCSSNRSSPQRHVSRSPPSLSCPLLCVLGYVLTAHRSPGLPTIPRARTTTESTLAPALPQKVKLRRSSKAQNRCLPPPQEQPQQEQPLGNGTIIHPLIAPNTLIRD